MRVTRRYRFCASHRLHAWQLNDEENRELYGKCNNPYGHGHDYVLDVSVRGPLDQASGRVVDIAALDALVSREVLRVLDHKNLNKEVAVFAQTPPTTENLVAEVDQRLRREWSGSFGEAWPVLDAVRILETRNNAVELRTGTDE